MASATRGDRNPVPALVGTAAGIAVFTCLTGLWAVLLNLMHRLPDDGSYDFLNNAIWFGVPATWIVGVAAAWFVTSNGPASLAGYLFASAALLVVGARALVPATNGMDIDSGGGASILAVPMLAVAFADTVIGLAILVSRVVLRHLPNAPPTAQPQ